MKKFLLVLLLVFSFAQASLRLFNDSPYKLRIVIRGADGSFLGEKVLLAQGSTTWYQGDLSFGSGKQMYEQPSRSVTPYTVQWYCPDGTQFAFCDNLSPGSSVYAESCPGFRYCKPPKKEKKSSPDSEPTQDDSDDN